FFFAGHGVQVDGQRYLLTYDANIASTGALKHTSLAATALMQELESVKVAHRVIMIDACRNDPTTGGKKPNLADEAFEAAFALQPLRGAALRPGPGGEAGGHGRGVGPAARATARADGVRRGQGQQRGTDPGRGGARGPGRRRAGRGRGREGGRAHRHHGRGRV